MHRTFSKLAMVGAAFAVIVGITVLITGEPASKLRVQPASPHHVGVVDDWSFHHLVFSNPGTYEQVAKDPAAYAKWLTIHYDTRFILQQMKRHAEDAASPSGMMEPQYLAIGGLRLPPWRPIGPPRPGPKPKSTLKGDWSMDMGTGAKVGAGMYPAKFSFDTTTASCTDFVVYNTSVAGSSTQASIVAYDNLYSSCTGQVPSVYWAFNTSGTVRISVVLSPHGDQVAFVQTPSSGNAQLVLLKWAAKPAGRTLTSGGTNITNGSKTFTTTSGLTSMDVGAGISGTGIPAGDTIATVTSATAGTLTNNATGNGTSGESLAITADAGGPDTLTAVGNSSYPGCAGPCMTTISFSGTSRSDTISSPFYDYLSDTIYVGDASGGLHKFNPVFGGTTPAEVGTPWVGVSTTALSSPVYDGTHVFVGDASGFLYSVNSSGTATKSVQVAASPGIVDGPLVDSTAGHVYAFVAQDYNSTNSSTSPCAALNSGLKTVCNGVIQLPTNFGTTTQFTESVTGVGTTNTLYDGAFDNLYWTTNTGNIYANAATGANLPKLMEIHVTTSGFSTAACQSGTGLPTNCSAVQCASNIVTMTSAAAAGSPVTEICNNGLSACTSSSTDYIFTSVSGSGNLSTTGCATGNACVYSWVTTTALGASAAPTAGLVAAAGTSGIIIDNTVPSGTLAGASRVYFSTLSNGTCTTSGTLNTGGCAVQASQSALN